LIKKLFFKAPGTTPATSEKEACAWLAKGRFPQKRSSLRKTKKKETPIRKKFCDRKGPDFYAFGGGPCVLRPPEAVWLQRKSRSERNLIGLDR